MADDPELDAMLDTIVVVEPERSEETSAQVASRAAHLLGMANPLCRTSPMHSSVLQVVKDAGFKVDGKMLDLLEELSKVLEPFMVEVRSVAGSALTQAADRLSEPERADG